MTDPFISTDDLSAVTGGDDLTTDPTAAIVLDSACEIVRGYIDNIVNLTEETIVLDGNGRGRLVLPQPPVRTVSDVLVDDDALTITDYELEDHGILRRIGSVWSRGIANIEITYTHGWDIAEPDDPEYADPLFERVPSDLRSVALALARRKFLAGTAAAVGVGGVIEESIGAGDYRYKVSEGAIATATAETLLDDETYILQRYRNPVNL